MVHFESVRIAKIAERHKEVPPDSRNDVLDSNVPAKFGGQTKRVVSKAAAKLTPAEAVAILEALEQADSLGELSNILRVLRARRLPIDDIRIVAAKSVDPSPAKDDPNSCFNFDHVWGVQ